nr:uncharacterized protein LOC113716076 [Coffea arabica]
MGRIIAHDIVVHYMGNTVRIPNVDPKNYQYIDLLGDVTDKAMNDLPGNLNMLVHMKCAIPRTTSFMDISSDKSVSDMFKLHEQDLVINLYLLHLDIIPTTEENMVDNRNNQLQDAQKDKGIEKAPILVVDSEGDDEIYASSSDDSWKDDMDSDLEDVIAEDRALISSSDKEENDLSDYEEIEDAQVGPDSESDQESDPLRAIMLSKMWTYNPREDIEFEKGMLFTNVDAFRAVLKDYAIQKGFPLVRLKNEKSRCTAKCGAEGCNWRIHASPVADTTTFMVKTYTPEHTCVMDRKNSEATSDWIAKKLISVMRDHPEMTSKGVKAEMQKHGVLPSRMQIYRAKKKALEQIEGSHSEAYGRLPKYAELLRINNPGSIMKIHYDRPNLLMEPKFLRLFISFKAQRDGFLAGCRPFIGFDGCHLKGAFGGILLTAVALDGNNSLFPLAFAVVECENKEAWSWFFYYFQDFFGPFPNNIPLTFMSDRQKGLNLAYEEQVPQAAARYCDWHIYSNFKVKFPGLLLRRFFWQAAKSYDLIGHNEAMEKIKNINIDAWRYLANIPKCNWARHAFSVEIKCDHVTNNFTESFNAWVGELRGKNILALADGLRQKFMKKLHKRYQKGCTWTSRLTPHVTGKLKDIASESRKCSLTMASENTFEVADVDKSYIVKLHERTCECGAFQLTGIPCKHAALGAIYRREKLESYCDAAFSRDQYLKTYAFMINPIPHMNRWPPMEDVTPAVVLPPPLRRRAGELVKELLLLKKEAAVPLQIR